MSGLQHDNTSSEESGSSPGDNNSYNLTNVMLHRQVDGQHTNLMHTILYFTHLKRTCLHTKEVHKECESIYVAAGI